MAAVRARPGRTTNAVTIERKFGSGEIAAAARLSIGKAINVKMTVLLKKKYSPELMRPRLRDSTGRSTSSTGVEVGEYLASCRVSGASSIGEFSLVERYQRNHKFISVFSLLGCGR